MSKRNKSKCLLGMLAGMAILLASAFPVLADTESEWIVDGSRLTEDTVAETGEMFDFTRESSTGIMPRTTYIYGGSGKITNAGGGKVTVYADTKAKQVCDLVEVDIYLQYYDSGSWVYVNNWNYSKKNVSLLTASRTLSVTKGRYYRIKCYHAVTKNGVKEKSTTMTDGIPIK